MGYGVYRHFNNSSAISWRSVLLVEETAMNGVRTHNFCVNSTTYDHATTAPEQIGNIRINNKAMGALCKVLKNNHLLF